MAAPATLPLPVRGGQYRTTGLPGGWVRIHDVPIFGELKARERSNPMPIGRAWHLAALADARVDERGGYLMPLHVGHHDDVTRVRRAGYVHPKDVSGTVYRGRRMSVVRADLYVPGHIAGEIRSGELPYCSVELGPKWDRPEIFSVALLDHEPPQFKFPLITLAASDAEGRKMMSRRQAGRTGRGRVVTFKFDQQGTAMPQDPNNPAASSDDNHMAVDADNAVTPGIRDEDGQMAMDGVLTPDEGATADPGAAAADAVVATDAVAEPEEQVPGWAAKMIALLELMADNAGIVRAPEEEFAGEAADVSADPPIVEPADEDDEMAKKRVGQMGAQGGGSLANNPEIVRLRAENEALKTRLDERDQREKFSAMLRDAETELAGKNVHVTQGMRDRMRETLEAAGTGDTGERMLKIVTDTFSQLGVADPPESLDDQDVEPVSDDAPELEFFSRQGPDELEYGRRLLTEWNASRASGSQLEFNDFCRARGVNIT